MQFGNLVAINTNHNIQKLEKLHILIYEAVEKNIH